MRLRSVLALAIISAAGTAALAQDRLASSPPAFEVASVKPNVNLDAPEGISVQPDGSARFTAFPVRTLIAMAYRTEGIQRFDQLVGGPSWIAVEKFDIVAKADSQTPQTPNRLPAMLRSLLRDRFGLRVHSETRQMPAYGLVMARRDRRLGRTLRQSTIDCSGATATAAIPTPDQWCGIRATGGLITGRAVSAAQLAGNLSGYPAVDRYVTDRTGLTGRYDFELEYSPAFLEPADAASAGASLFTALTEQLGLRLQPETIVAPVLVIDQIERPAPDP